MWATCPAVTTRHDEHDCVASKGLKNSFGCGRPVLPMTTRFTESWSQPTHLAGAVVALADHTVPKGVPGHPLHVVLVALQPALRGRVWG